MKSEFVNISAYHLGELAIQYNHSEKLHGLIELWHYKNRKISEVLLSTLYRKPGFGLPASCILKNLLLLANKQHQSL